MPCELGTSPRIGPLCAFCILGQGYPSQGARAGCGKSWAEEYRLSTTCVGKIAPGVERPATTRRSAGRSLCTGSKREVLSYAGLHSSIPTHRTPRWVGQPIQRCVIPSADGFPAEREIWRGAQPKLARSLGPLGKTRAFGMTRREHGIAAGLRSAGPISTPSLCSVAQGRLTRAAVPT
jgi:hypothetical protein